MTEVQPIPKSDLSTPGHPRGCRCNPCRGLRSKRSGSKGQSVARRAFEKQTGAQAKWQGRLANEETWSHLPVRVEVKSGAQCGPAWTRFVKAEAQSNAAHATGDPRPFVAVLMPKGTADGLVAFRLSQLEQVVSALSG